MNNFTESEERLALRKAVADLGAKYGRDYFEQAAKEGRKTTELWEEAGKLGYLGVAVPEEFGGGLSCRGLSRHRVRSPSVR